MGDFKWGGSTPDDVRLGTSKVDKIYCGGELIYPPESPGPAWLPPGFKDLLDSMTPLADQYCDIAYEVTNSTSKYEYFRIYCTPNGNCSLLRSDNWYSVFQMPYNPDFRGFSARHIYWSTINNEWVFAGDVLNTDRGATLDYLWTQYVHRAIVNSNFLSLTNETGDYFEDYREQ